MEQPVPEPEPERERERDRQFEDRRRAPHGSKPKLKQAAQGRTTGQTALYFLPEDAVTTAK
jgi:hypothetical protein